MAPVCRGVTLPEPALTPLPCIQRTSLRREGLRRAGTLGPGSGLRPDTPRLPPSSPEGQEGVANATKKRLWKNMPEQSAGSGRNGLAGKSPDSKKPNCRNCRSDEPEGARSKTLPAVDALSYADHNLHKFVFKEA